MSGEKYNFDEPVEIAEKTFWVGNRESSLWYNNIYLRVFEGAGTRVNLIIDPGPPSDLAVLTGKIQKVIGDLKNLHFAFINHQDPDVAYNAGYLQSRTPNLWVLCSEDSWRLSKYYGLNPQRYLPLESFKDLTMKLTTGHELLFVPTHFCHSRGAVMLYDLATRVLFTGDLFGGLSYTNELYADDGYWEGLKAFHQIYMPSSEAVKSAVNRIWALEPFPLVLAPQHGNIIACEWVEPFLEKLEALPVGFNLLLNRATKENYIDAMNELLLELGSFLGADKILSAMHAFQGDGSFPHMIQLDSRRGVIDIKIDPKTAMDTFIKNIKEQTPEQMVLLLEANVFKVFLKRNLPLPEYLLARGAESPAFILS